MSIPHGWRPLASALRRLTLGLGLGLLLAGPGQADPIDEAYYRTFYIAPIGAWGAEDPVPANGSIAAYPYGIGNVTEYRTSMLSLVGGVEPKNIKAAISNGVSPAYQTQSGYYDYIYEPFYEMMGPVNQAISKNVMLGMHVNVMPWGDSADQSVDILHNYLEKYNGGEFLQRDRSNRIRLSSNTQDPTINEAYDAFSPMLEMQLTLSRNATLVQSYLARNVRQAARILHWFREEHPDLLFFVSGSSEYAMHSINSDWWDYSNSMKQEFRDWLSGAGFYTGQGQYASFAAFKADANIDTAVSSFTSWSSVVPPTTVSWSTSTDAGRWWNKWNAFRIGVVNNMVQSQTTWMNEAGWDPDRVFGHQIPFSPTTTSDAERRYASPWTTTFVQGGSNGITTYGSNAASTTIFSAIYANDKNWGIFEHNRLSTVVSDNTTALNNLYNNKAHIISPYAWGGQETYRIQGGSAYEQALRQFIQAKQSTTPVLMDKWETAPESRDIVWAMSESDDIEVYHDLTSASFSGGQLSVTINGADPYLYFEQNDPTNLIYSDAYHALTLRMNCAIAGTAELFWGDENWNHSSLVFPVSAGWNYYRINLADNPNWLGKKIRGLRIDPPGGTGQTFQLDWVRLHANPCWHFDATGEVYGQSGLASGAGISGGQFSGTDNSNDGFVYLATDKNSTSVDADRAFIDADFNKVLRFKLTAAAAGSTQLYWWKPGSAPYAISVAVAAGTQTYTVDLSGVADWSGHVTRLRIDPVNTSGVAFNLDYVSLAPRMQPPRSVFPDTILNTTWPVLYWTTPIEPNHGGIVYDLQIATDFAFGSIVDSQSGLTGASYMRTAGALDGAHWWRIRARDGAGQVSPWSVPMPLFFRVWNGNSTGDVSFTNDFTAISASGGVWSATTADTNGDGIVDPHLLFNSGYQAGGRINCDVYNRLRLRIKVTGGSGYAPAQVFFVRGGSSPLTRAVDFNLPLDGQWHDMDVDLSQDPYWTGYIDYVRLDPVTQGGLTVQIDQAQLVPAAINWLPAASWTFNTDGNYEGWSPAGTIASSSVAGGILTVNSNGADPILLGPSLNVDTLIHKQVRVRLKNSTSAVQGELFWITSSDATWEGVNKHVAFSIVPNDTQQRDYVIDLSANAAWANRITQLRVDPQANSSGLVEVDQIEIIE